MAEYEKDEFDALARQDGPVGVHRAPRRWWTRALVPLVVLVVAGAAGAGVVALNWSNDGADVAAEPSASSEPSPDASDTAEPEPTVAPSETQSPEPEPVETEEPEPEPVLVRDAQIHVRNASGIAGLAGANQALLEADGFTNLEANNIDAGLIPGGTNAVVYSDDRVAGTAERVAVVLGIDSVLQQDTPGGAEIEVLLASDPAA